jgi:beta-glucosidase
LCAVVADIATGVRLSAQQLVGPAQVELEPGQSKTAEFAIPLSVLAYTGSTGEVVVEPGLIELSTMSSWDDIRSTDTFTISG